MASTSKAFNKCVDPCPRYLRWHTQSLRLLFGQGARTRCPWGENLCATSSTFAGRRHMIGKVVKGCVAILPYHTATQDRGSECRDFGFISRIVTALVLTQCILVWYGNISNQDCKALQRVVRLAERTSGSALPSLHDIYLKQCKSRAVKLIKDSNHPGNSLFILLPYGKRFNIMVAKPERLRRSFFHQATRLLNSNSVS